MITAAVLRCAVMLSAAAMAGAQTAPVPPTAAQSAGEAASAQTAGPARGSPGTQSREAKKLPTGSERRRAAKLYLTAATLYQHQQFEQALGNYEKAAALDPGNRDYSMAVEVARSHAVTALIQAAARDRTRGDAAAARAALSHALELDPQNRELAQHLSNFTDNAGRPAPEADAFVKPPALAPPIDVVATPGVHSFHLHTGQRQVIQQVFRAYGVEPSIDDSVRTTVVRLDVDDVAFGDAARIVGMLTGTFYVPMDPHRVLVLRDTRALQMQYAHNAVETLPLSGLSVNEMTEMGNVARNVFEVQQAAVNPSAATLTLRTSETNIEAFNATYRDLMEGQPQVLLDIRVIQLAHNSTANTGVQPPQTITGFNLYAEEQSILNQNQSLVQEIIASGLASPGDTLKILAILLASGQVSSSLFANGFATFGGGLTASAISPGGPATLNLNLNSSDSRELDNYQLRLGDGEEGTLKSGTRYPIQTSSFSSLSSGGLNIPGLSLPGTSGSLGSLLSSLTNTVPNIPQVQYEDLGLVLKARPRVMRSGNVALGIDMKITALAGQALNGVPALANRSYVGEVMLRANEGFVVAAEVDKSESRAISGLPGLSDIPGLNDVTDKDTQKNYATLLIIMTPYVVRSPHPAGHGPMLMVEHSPQTR